MRLYESLKNCATREEVRAACLAAFGLSFPAREKVDSTGQVLYIFRREKRFGAKGQGSAGAGAVSAAGTQIRRGDLSRAALHMRGVPRGGAACARRPLFPLLRAAAGGGVRLGPHPSFALSRPRRRFGKEPRAGPRADVFAERGIGRGGLSRGARQGAGGAAVDVRAGEKGDRRKQFPEGVRILGVAVRGGAEREGG